MAKEYKPKGSLKVAGNRLKKIVETLEATVSSSAFTYKTDPYIGPIYRAAKEALAEVQEFQAKMKLLAAQPESPLQKLVRDLLEACSQHNAACKFILTSGRLECPECFSDKYASHADDCKLNIAHSNLEYEVRYSIRLETVRAFLEACTFRGRLGQFHNPKHGRVDCPECHWPVRHAEDCKFGVALQALADHLEKEGK